MEKIKLMYLVDDDIIFTKIAKFNIDKYEFIEELKAFENGQLALDNLKNLFKSDALFPDFILLDLNMPVIDGWEFLDEFCKLDLPKKIPVFISTSSINPEDIERAKQYDVVREFITKPLNKEKLDIIYNNLKH